MRRNHRVYLIAQAAACLLLGCTCGSKKPSPANQTGSEASSASAPQTQADARPLELFNVTQGHASFALDGKRQTTHGSIGGLQGDLQFDVGDLSRSSGMISLDLTTLETHTFDDIDKDRAQTLDALTSLELHARSAPKELRERYQLAVFTIRSIDAVRPPSLGELTGTRSVLATVSGDLRLHGFTVQQTLELEASFEFSDNKLKRVHIKTDEPFEVNLARYAITPRDANGEALALPPGSPDQPAESALVTLDLTAESTGKPAEP